MTTLTTLTSKSNNADLSKILSGPVNPLYDVAPPTHVRESECMVLLQAKDIKDVLQSIYKKDPTARSHFFPYAIYPENEKILHHNGFSTKQYYDNGSKEILTEVSWDNKTNWVITIPVPS